MKVSAAALATLLLLVICSPAEVQLDDTFFMTCCYNYVRRPIPHRIIASIMNTSTECPRPAVVLVTKRGVHICANPDEPWVQELRKHFQK